MHNITVFPMYLQLMHNITVFPMHNITVFPCRYTASKPAINKHTHALQCCPHQSAQFLRRSVTHLTERREPLDIIGGLLKVPLKPSCITAMCYPGVWGGSSIAPHYAKKHDPLYITADDEICSLSPHLYKGRGRGGGGSERGGWSSYILDLFPAGPAVK